MKLTVIIAAGYPRPYRLRALLGLLASQTRPPDEVIVADDTGVTPSPFTIEAPLPFFVTPSGVPAGVNGVSVARNRAAAVATGDALLFLDDDSLPHKQCCQVHIEGHEQHGDKVDAILGQRCPDYGQLRRGVGNLPPLSDKARAEQYGPLGWGNFISNNLSVRTDKFLGIGGFDEDFAQPDEYGWEDIELGIRWFAAGYKLGYTCDAMVWHPDVPRTPAKQERADRAWLRLVRKHPEIVRRAT